MFTDSFLVQKGKTCRVSLILAGFFIFFSLMACSTEDRGRTISQFRFDSLSINGFINETDKTILAVVPPGTDITSLVPKISHEGESIRPESQVEQDFSNPVVYKVKAESGQTGSYTVTVAVSDIPVMLLNTPESVPVTSTEEWVSESTYSLIDSSGTETAGETKIKGRGFSTWNFMPKKPYSLKLSEKAGFFGMPEDKRWALLANYADKTLLRNEVALKLGREMLQNMSWSPDSEQVVLYFNSEYQGVYQLTEQIKIDGDRVDIESIEDFDPSIDDYKNFGYLLEVDERMDEEFYFTTTQGVIFTCKDPDEDLENVFDLIVADVQEAEDAIYSPGFADTTDGYAKYIDTDSFIDWYLANEITKNRDAIFFSSCYMYFDPADKKYHMGPIWDFDISLGNIYYDGCDITDGFYIKNAKWISRLFQDTAFAGKVKSRWNEKRTDIYTLLGFIDDRAAEMNSSQTYNFYKWDILNTWVWPNKIVTGSYEGEIDYLKSWLENRLDWLDSQYQ
ncbi:MAG: CotH kinase family protein [Spirochaetes bacterium]|nr:CotH kinase family protein [Spirochaetota bacterium]